MAYEERFAIRKMTITNAGFTDIQGLGILPIGCNFVVIENTTGEVILLRTDPNNANSERSIPIAGTFTIGASGTPRGSARFPQGCNAVGSLKSSTTPGVQCLIESSD